MVLDNFAYRINIYRYYSCLILPVDRCRKLFKYSVNPVENISKFKHQRSQV